MTMAYLFSNLGKFYRQAYQAVTDFEFYRQVYRQPTAQTVVYLILLLFHTGFLGTLYRSVFWLPTALNFTQWLLENSPPLQLHDGQLQVDAELPLLLRHPSPEGPTFIFVQSAQDPLPSYQPPAFILAREGLHIFGESAPLMPWASFMGEAASKSEIEEQINRLSLLAIPVLFLLILTISALLIPAEALIFSLFGYSAGARFKRPLPFRCHFTIAVYGLTPAVLIDLLGRSLGLGDTLFRILYVATAAIYIFTATNKILGGKQTER